MKRRRFTCQKCEEPFWAVRADGNWHRPPKKCPACARAAVTWHGAGPISGLHRIRRTCLKCAERFWVVRSRKVYPCEVGGLPNYCPPCRTLNNPYGRQRYSKKLEDGAR